MGDAPTRRFDGTTVIDNPTGYKLPMGSIRVSFQAGEQGSIKIRIPFRARITRIRSIVTSVISAGGSGTVTFASPDGELAELEHEANSGIGAEEGAEPFTNNVFEVGQDLTITTEKTAAGGRVAIDMDLERISGP